MTLQEIFTPERMLYLLAGISIVLLIALVVVGRRTNRQLTDADTLQAENNKLQVEHAVLSEKLAGAHQRLEETLGQVEALNQTNTRLTSENTELKSTQAERDRSHKQQLEHFDQQKQALSEQFKVLANDILEAKTKSFQESSQTSLNAIINPFLSRLTASRRKSNRSIIAKPPSRGS